MTDESALEKLRCLSAGGAKKWEKVRKVAKSTGKVGKCEKSGEK